MTVVRNPQDQRSSFAYDAGDRRTVARQGNGTRTSLAYDSANQATQVFHRKSDGTSILQLDYRYDVAGNRTVQIEGGSTARTTWAYDAQVQLLGEHRTGTNAYRQTFAYDPAGNRTWKNVDGVRTTFHYDSTNQLTYRLAAASRTTYAYDAAGNQRVEQPPAGARTTPKWDYENQPTQYLLPTASPVTMVYNADNRRVRSHQSTTVTKFVWDMPTDAHLSELDSANATQVVYTNEPVRYGSVISQRRGSTTHWLHAHALGSTRILTTSAGASSETYLSDAWGNLITSSESTTSPFHRVGRHGYCYDSVSGLFYIRARTFQPMVARWSSADPSFSIVPALRTRFPALFVALGNAPIHYVDPTGLQMAEPYETCLNKVILFQQWLNAQTDLSWQLGLPNCPCNSVKVLLINGYIDPCIGFQMWVRRWWEWQLPGDDSTWERSKDVEFPDLHPGAEICMRSTARPGVSGQQQCCYDATGQLITRGLGAATPDESGPDKGWLVPFPHFVDDVAAFAWAGLLDLHCSHLGAGGDFHFRRKYFEKRLPNQGRQNDGRPCPANPPVEVCGWRCILPSD